MLLTSPLTVTLGLSLSIPLALVGDLVYRRAGEPVKLAAIAGGVLVLGSFVANGILDLREAERRAMEEAAEVAAVEEAELAGDESDYGGAFERGRGQDARERERLLQLDEADERRTL